MRHSSAWMLGTWSACSTGRARPCASTTARRRPRLSCWPTVVASRPGCRRRAWRPATGSPSTSRTGPTYVRLLLACAVGGFVAVSVEHALLRRRGRRLGRPFGRPQDRRSTTGGGHVDPMRRSRGADDPFIVFTTSGTTSRPKMVLHAQRSIATPRLGHGRIRLRLHGRRHRHGRDAAVRHVRSGLADGRRRRRRPVVVTNFDVERTADAIVPDRVTSVNGSDDMFHRLLLTRRRSRIDRLGGYARFNTSLDRVVVDAERCRRDAHRPVRDERGAGPVQRARPDRSVRRPGDGEQVGTLVSPEAAYRIVDGELQLRGPSLMVGYLTEGGDRGRCRADGAHFDDGWFRTGDLADGGRRPDVRVPGAPR